MKQPFFFKRKTVKPATLLLAAFLPLACKKDSNTAPPVNQPGCKLVKETTSLTGNEAYFEYHYDNAGKPVKRVRFYSNGRPWDSIIIRSDQVIRYNPDKSYSRVAYYEGTRTDGVPTRSSNIYEELPGLAKVYVKLADPSPGVQVPETYYCDYIFAYDSKKRVAAVTADYTTAGAYDFKMTFSYDDRDNLTIVQLDRITGPRVEPTFITCKEYDDKPAPYSGIRNWPFVIGLDWMGWDTRLLFNSLSKNNALRITSDSYTITSSAKYNEQGYPTEETVGNKTTAAEYSYTRTFVYNCN